MESSNEEHVLEVIENDFSALLKNPEVYIESQPEKADCFKQLSKKLYNTAINKNCLFKGRALPKLLIKGFDEEQIWQQSDLLNKSALSNISEIVRGVNPHDIAFHISKHFKQKSSTLKKDGSKSISNHNNISDADLSSEEDGYAFDDDSDSPTEFEKDNSKAQKIDDNHDLESDPDSELEVINKKAQKVDQEYAFEDDSDSEFEISDKEAKKIDQEYVFDGDSDSELERNNNKAQRIDQDQSSDNDSDLDAEFVQHNKSATIGQNKPNYKSVVDDQFFKLSQLEQFLRLEDVREEKKDEITSADDEIDYFQDIPSDDTEDFDEESADEGTQQKKSSRDLKHDDFFDPIESEAEDKNNMDENEEIINDNNNAIEMEDGLEDDGEKNIGSKSILKTPFELQQEKMRKKIQEYEKNMLKPLSWELTGEIDASHRPVDSLIHHEAEFDSNAKQDLMIDKVLTEKIEEITKMAIRNKAYCDVVRKVKPIEEMISHKKEVIIEQTKSKKSLAEVYEEDYLKKQSKNNEEEEDPKHKEIKRLMDSLFPKLHALFTHIPKPAVPEIKVVTNLPAVTIEEVAPTSVSDVTLLAPEEVKKKSGLIKGKTERSETDRKRERRKKKIHQRLKEKKKMEKLESLKANPSAKMSKLEKMETLKKLKQHKNTKIAAVDEGGKIKSSKDFFSRLQDTVDQKSKTKDQVKKGKL